ncbi:hypothetical protein GCU56_15365 [Geodermatophilus sabuli]|uniref:Uncharacterized protein n=1 Tax=Geodermatophilus sabuli TaxID=1564158 RepID=A0A7K3W4U6_9ACTN|nr:hypothetical protein [Geodermatophilus sabuli]NEK59244.1 hypothetical protein [Geodermatophilus sabuli]
MSTPDDDLDTAMATGSDAGVPGEHLGDGELTPDEERLLAELSSGGPAEPIGDTDAMARAAEDEAPLPAAGGDQGDGLSARFSAPPAEPG